MIVYSLMSIAIVVFGFVFGNIDYGKSRKTSIISFVFILSIMVFVYASRYYVGTDFGGYLRQFNTATRQSFEQFTDSYRDIGFYGLTWVLNRIYNGNWLLYNATLAVLTYLPILVVIRNEIGEFFVYSALLYVFTMSYFSGFNGVRQAIATGLVFYAYYMCFKNKKYVKYILIIAVAYLFHSTALFVIPFHILSNIKVKSKIFPIVTAGFTISYFLIWNMWEKLMTLFESMGQDKLVNDYAEIEVAEGSSFLRLLVCAMPVIVALLFYNRIKEFDGDNNDLDKDIVLSTFSTIFTLFSMKYWLFSRVGLYFITSQILLIPKLSKIFYSVKAQKIFMFLMAILYYAYMMALLSHGDGELVPYVFSFGKDLSRGLI